eukprot:CAMPEP_0195059678 /NCGR_PEP_ID=MMETSP0448-20130528/7111_1 /TAXON_ID=66468 /ORGANISM="Heterocapsa triquestra, Strain CCMP 448" /LENGTH=585 /DNA_ID=CAMNT_0040089995 /DNA_START=211 /DNA_END=1968 /DNA_ORIENTATION=+
MSSELGIGLGYAATLLQVHLGIGFILVVVGAAGKSASGGAAWEVTLRSAAAAAGPVPLLATFALIQASGASPDFLTFAGLAVATASVLLGTLLALLIPTLGLNVADVNSKTGEIICESFDDESGLAARLSMAARAVSCLRFLGASLLLFGAVPAGTQLLFSSVLLRLALLIYAACAATHALGISFAPLVAAAEHAAKVAPLAGGLGLLDHLAYGPATMLTAPMQPSVYIAAVAALQLGLILVAAGEPQEPLRFEFDLGLGSVFPETIAHVSIGGFYLSLAIGTVRVLTGTYDIQASLSGFSIEWGAPLVAAAALLATLHVLVHLLEVVLAHITDKTLLANGATNGDHAVDTSTIGNIKAVVAPIFTLALALVTMHLGQPASTGSMAADMTLALATMPLRYGFVLAAAGVALQVLMLVVFTVSHCDEEPVPPPPFDGSGCLQWEPEGDTACKAVTGIRWATLTLLVGGLALGWVGLGTIPWVIIGATVVPLVYAFLPAEAREVAGGVVATAIAGLKHFVEFLMTCAGGFMSSRQQALAAMAEKRAAEKAAAMMAEMGESEAKKNKAKGTGKGKAAPQAWKAPKKHK